MPRRQTAGGQERWEESSPDRGCWAAPRCLACPWARCVKELPADERRALRGALVTIAPYLRRADGVAW